MYDDFVNFLIEAKRKTYASNSKANIKLSSRKGLIEFQFIKGDFTYIDSYVGSSNFSGQEIVYKNNIPFWSMNYYGRVLDESFSGDFLKEALSNNTFDMPYRGPSKFYNADYTYVSSVNGSIEYFIGKENIFYQNKLIYELDFHGGLIK